jgi:hypothetical protein
MTDFNDSDLRHKIYRQQRTAFLDTVENCQALRKSIELVVQKLSHLEPAPILARRRDIAPPPMPAESGKITPEFNYPSKTDVETALMAREAARQGVIDAWNAMSRVEQKEAKEPPSDLSLQLKPS